MTTRKAARAARAAQVCACGRPASHPGLCKARVAERRQGGAQPLPRAKSPALVEALAALEDVHDACIRFSSAWTRVRRGDVSPEALIEAHPESIQAALEEVPVP